MKTVDLFYRPEEDKWQYYSDQGTTKHSGGHGKPLGQRPTAARFISPSEIEVSKYISSV